MIRLSFLMFFGLSYCQGDETISGYGAADANWALVELNGTSFTAKANLQFPEEGRIEGNAPCNTFFGQQTAPYPWFAIEAVGMTRMACPEMDAEDAFLTALHAMTIAEISGTTLILSDDAGGEMVFSSD